MAIGLDHHPGKDHDQDDDDDFGQRRLELANAAHLHPLGQTRAVAFGQREHEADGDTVGEDHEDDAEQKGVDRLEHRHGDLPLRRLARRHQRVPGLVQVEAALKEHQERVDHRPGGADQHDGPKAKQESYQGIVPQR